MALDERPPAPEAEQRVRRRRRLWLLGYVGASFFSFPHPLPFTGGAVVLDGGLLFSWWVPACLVLALRGQSLRRAATSAFLATVVAHGLIFHFIYVVTVTYGRAPVVVGALAPFLLALYPGVLAAVFAAAWVWLRDRGAAGPFSVAVLWVVCDYLRSVLLTGWPWATLGYAQHLNPGLLGLAPFTGVYGLSFTVALGGGVIAARIAGRRAPPGLWVALGAVVLLHVVGFAVRTVPGENDEMEDRTVRIAVLQGNVDQRVKWNAAWIERTLASYEDLSRQAAERGAEIIVWPETAVPGALEADHALRERLLALARELGRTFVIGGVGVEVDPSTDRVIHFFDSAFQLEGADGFVDRYDKTHLVPFGEYVPLRGLVGGWLGAVAGGIASGDVTPGAAPRALLLRPPRAGGGLKGGVKVGVPICYELLFPDLVRRFVDDGGGLLLGVTNDAWYGRTGAPYHFLAITALRSAETGVWTARAANSGVSAIIDSGGWVRERTPIFERSLLIADVPVRSPSGEGTFYVRHGDVFARGVCATLVAIVIAAALRALRSRANEQVGRSE